MYKYWTHFVLVTDGNDCSLWMNGEKRCFLKNGGDKLFVEIDFESVSKPEIVTSICNYKFNIIHHCCPLKIS